MIKTVSTGIPELDRALGGGFLEGSIPLIVGETYSNSWALGLEIFKRIVDQGFFGVIVNYYGPVSLIKRHASVIGLDIEKLGEKGDLGIIDIFGSQHGVEYEEPYVFSIGDVDAGTFLIKTANTYRDIVKKYANGRTPIGLTITMDGFAHIFGEDVGLRILRKNLAMRETARRSYDEGPITLTLLHRDRVSTYFLSWLVSYSEHVIDLRPTKKACVEELVVRKSLLRDFVPVSGELKLSRGKVEVKIKKKDPAY